MGFKFYRSPQARTYGSTKRGFKCNRMMSNAYTENKRRETYVRYILGSCRWTEKWWRMPLSHRNELLWGRSCCCFSTTSHPSASSTFQIRENQLIKKTNEICRIQKRKGIKNHKEQDTTWSEHPGAKMKVSCPTKNALSPSAPTFPADGIGKEKMQDVSRIKLSIEE